MTEIELSKLSRLSEQQLAACDDELKAVFALLDDQDQVFFAANFSPKDLPHALERKAEILKHNRDNRERLARLKALLAQSAGTTNAALSGGQGGDDLITSVAAAAGIGAVAYAVATDNTAHWIGVQPRDLVAPLETEFGDQEMTDVEFEGSADALEGTVFLVSGSRFVPALTINLIRKEEGVEVKVGDLTSQGFLETLRGGGEKLFSLAMKGLSLWTRKGRGVAPVDLAGVAGSAFQDSTRLAQIAGNLKIKDRAWSVIRNSASAIEKAFQDRQIELREQRAALERAWDNYINCPSCAVPFGDGDTTCRVCGTARPEAPRKPDPRSL
jgi:hypothetical protein